MPRVYAAITVLFLSICVLAPPADGTEPPSSPKLKLATERVVIFKDGHGLVVKSAVAIADADGRAFTPDVPDGAVLGCFWAIGQDKKILGMRAEWDTKTEVRESKTPALTIAELLRANLGKTVTLELSDRTDRGVPLTRDGTLLEMLELPAALAPAPKRDPDAGPAPGPIVYSTLIRDGVVTSGAFTPESIPGGGTLVRELQPRGSDFVVVMDAGRRVVVPVAHIQGVTGSDGLSTSVTRREEFFTRSKRLSFDFGKESVGKEVSLKLFYFTAGLRWIPTYRVGGDLKDKADLALQGEILNDVTDIEHAALDLVVGVPNFRFKDTLSPLTLEQTLQRAVAVTYGGINSYMGQQVLSNANFINGAGNNEGAVALPANPGGDAAPELANATGEQDLFVYDIKDFSLRKGARATVPLWQQSTGLQHVYTLDLHANRSHSRGRVSSARAMRDSVEPQDQGSPDASPQRISTNRVWHQLELSNASTIPWTTGAALMVRDTLPIGQDLLTYTPPGTKALLPVTIAVDVRGDYDEQELERKPNAVRFDDVGYMQVTKKGSITVTNYRREKSAMRVTVATGGKVTAASDDGKIRINDFLAGDWDEPSYARMNNHSDVSWEFTIEPGATKTITYEAMFFVR